MFSPRWWVAAVALLLILMVAIEVTAALQESQTYDEAVHLAAGYRYLRTGDFRMNPEHPPLGKLLAALPLLAMHPALPAEDPAWGGDQRMYGAAFLYRNRVDASRMLMAGRRVTIAAALALGLAIACWMRSYFGAGPAVAALLLYVLDANILAHGRYVTNDLLISLWCFLACTLWCGYLERRGWRVLLAAGLVLGLALATKFSAVFLLPVLALLGWRRCGWRAPAALLALAALVVLAVYAPETARLLAHPGDGPRLADRIEHGTWVGSAFYQVGLALHLPAHTYLVGLESAARHDRLGQVSYLLGETSQTGGWWYYFPVAFAVKAPTALVLLSLAAAVIGLASLRAWRQTAPVWSTLLVPLVIYAALALNSSLNIGFRHLLPLYPFLICAATAAVWMALRNHRRLFWAVCAVTAALQVAEAVYIYPHHLAFFNLLAGGPELGPDYLLDSNLDWGQDVIHLRRWLDAHGNPPVCFVYFGTADTAYYGVPLTGLPQTNDPGRARLDCVGAISVNLLYDLYMRPGAFRWLRERQPIGQVGWSIYLFDLRRR